MIITIIGYWVGVRSSPNLTLFLTASRTVLPKALLSYQDWRMSCVGRAGLGHAGARVIQQHETVDVRQPSRRVLGIACAQARDWVAGSVLGSW